MLYCEAAHSLHQLTENWTNCFGYSNNPYDMNRVKRK